MTAQLTTIDRQSGISAPRQIGLTPQTIGEAIQLAELMISGQPWQHHRRDSVGSRDRLTAAPSDAEPRRDQWPPCAMGRCCDRSGTRLRAIGVHL